MGAGALRPKTPASAAVGFGVAWILSNGGLLNTLGGSAGILHSRNQSMARAELLAAVEALQLSKSATQQVFIWTDCLFVINGFARGRRRKHLTHADVWEEAHDAIALPLSCSTKSEKATPPRQRSPQGSFHHWRHTVTKLQTNWQQDELCGTPSPWSMLPQSAAQTVE